MFVGLFALIKSNINRDRNDAYMYFMTLSLSFSLQTSMSVNKVKPSVLSMLHALILMAASCVPAILALREMGQVVKVRYTYVIINSLHRICLCIQGVYH